MKYSVAIKRIIDKKTLEKPLEVYILKVIQ